MGRSTNELQLTVSNKCGKNNECSCKLKPSGIIASRNDISESAKGFVSLVHTSQTQFTLSNNLGDDEELQSGSIQNVTSVSVYYWEGDPEYTKPLLLEVIKNHDHKKPEYYYRYSECELEDKPEGEKNPHIWKRNPHNHRLQIRLDDRNCGRNDVIVFNITNSQHGAPVKDPKSDCLKNKRKIESTKSASPLTIPGGNYTVKEYTISGVNTKISRVTYSGADTSGIDLTKNGTISRIRIYEWKHKRNVPLLLEFISGNNSIWFENLAERSLAWKSVNPEEASKFFTDGSPKGNPTENFTNKLEDINCRVNHTVSIDVTKTQGQYCHNGDKHANNKVYVQEVDKGSLGCYTAYAHTPNPSAYTEIKFPYTFNISAFTGGRTQTIKLGGTPGKPIMDVKNVIVYMCENEKEKTPLLMYYQTLSGFIEPKVNNHWYKNTDGAIPGNWDTTLELSNTDDTTQHEKIIKALDTLTSKCKPPEVTIDISKKTTLSGYKSPGSISEWIKVELKTSRYSTELPKNYDIYLHKAMGRQNSYFILNKLVYNGSQNEITVDNASFPQGGTPMENVTSVSAYYWQHLNNGRPLLMKIEQAKHKSDSTGGKVITWYENMGENHNNTKWKKVAEPRDPETALKDSSTLEKKLDLLNCRLSYVTPIDISQRPTKINGNSVTYCHDDIESDLDSNHPKLIRVEDGTLGGFIVYKHIIYNDNNHGKSFNISGFYKGTTSIQLGQAPVLNVSHVLVYYCSSDPQKGEPLLIHFTYNGDSTKVWYKKVPEKDEWEKVSDGIPTSEGDTTKILTILNNYATPCQDKSWVYITSGGTSTLGAGGTGYAGWYFWKNYFFDPLVRLI